MRTLTRRWALLPLLLLPCAGGFRVCTLADLPRGGRPVALMVALLPLQMAALLWGVTRMR